MLYICIYSAPANNILSHLFIIQQQRELASEARSNYFYFCFFYCFFFFPSLRQVRVRSVKAPFSSFGSNSLRWLINWACTKTVKENIFAPLTHKNKNRNIYIKRKATTTVKCCSWSQSSLVDELFAFCICANTNIFILFACVFLLSNNTNELLSLFAFVVCHYLPFLLAGIHLLRDPHEYQANAFVCVWRACFRLLRPHSASPSLLH